MPDASTRVTRPRFAGILLPVAIGLVALGSAFLEPAQGAGNRSDRSIRLPSLRNLPPLDSIRGELKDIRREIPGWAAEELRDLIDSILDEFVPADTSGTGLPPPAASPPSGTDSDGDSGPDPGEDDPDPRSEPEHAWDDIPDGDAFRSYPHSPVVFERFQEGYLSATAPLFPPSFCRPADKEEFETNAEYRARIRKAIQAKYDALRATKDWSRRYRVERIEAEALEYNADRGIFRLRMPLYAGRPGLFLKPSLLTNVPSQRRSLHYRNYVSPSGTLDVLLLCDRERARQLKSAAAEGELYGSLDFVLDTHRLEEVRKANTTARACELMQSLFVVPCKVTINCRGSAAAEVLGVTD